MVVFNIYMFSQGRACAGEAFTLDGHDQNKLGQGVRGSFPLTPASRRVRGLGRRPKGLGRGGARHADPLGSRACAGTGWVRLG